MPNISQPHLPHPHLPHPHLPGSMAGGRRGHSPSRARARRPSRRAASDSDSDDLDFRAFSVHLGRQGLCVRDVASDGSCMFRAVSDQLYGDEDHHMEIRRRCVKYMVDHRDDFAPFVDDSKCFEEYTADMAREGIWGGNLELQALSMVLGANLRIWQIEGANYDIRNHHALDAPCLHLSYHLREHYASVRPKEAANTSLPAGHPPLPIQASDADDFGPASRDQRQDSELSPEDEYFLRIVREQACGVEESVAASFSRLHTVYSEFGPPRRQPSGTELHTPNEPRKAMSRREVALHLLDDEAASIRDILLEADQRARKVVVITSGSTENSMHHDKRSARSRKRILCSLEDACARSTTFEKDVHGFCAKLAQTAFRRGGGSSPVIHDDHTAEKNKKPPSKKKVQEAKRADRKARRLREQERDAIQGPAAAVQRHDEVDAATGGIRDIAI
jgi:hypothetical protein